MLAARELTLLDCWLVQFEPGVLLLLEGSERDREPETIETSRLETHSQGLQALPGYSLV